MKTAFKNITTIQTGVFAKPIPKGEIVYLQAKHFDENGELTNTLFPDLKADGKIEKHLLKNGDILFAAKGTKNFAACYETENIPAVASTSFFVIRLQTEEILPGYLTWFLNHPNTQYLLKGKAIGTSIASISKAVLEDLEITIPSIRKQELVLKIYKLRNKEKKLKLQIEILREKQIQKQISKAVKL